MPTTEERLWEICRHDPRYPVEAYQFALDGLNFTQHHLGRVPTAADFLESRPENHVSGRELLQGMCELAKREFGFMAHTVFRQWGILRTDDLGEIVFNLIDSGMLSRTESDSRADFHNVFNVERALSEGASAEFEEHARNPRGR